MTTPTPEQLEQFDTYIAALESGTYTQLRGHSRSSDDNEANPTMFCAGALGKYLIPGNAADYVLMNPFHQMLQAVANVDVDDIVHWNDGNYYFADNPESLTYLEIAAKLKLAKAEKEQNNAVQD